MMRLCLALIAVVFMLADAGAVTPVPSADG